MLPIFYYNDVASQSHKFGKIQNCNYLIFVSAFFHSNTLFEMFVELDIKVHIFL